MVFPQTQIVRKSKISTDMKKGDDMIEGIFRRTGVSSLMIKKEENYTQVNLSTIFFSALVS